MEVKRIKRISLLLPSDDLKLLIKISEKAGETVSNRCRRIIEKNLNTKLSHRYSLIKNPAKFTLRLDSELYYNLKQVAHNSSITISEYIRIIFNKELSTIKNKSLLVLSTGLNNDFGKNQIKSLWLKGNLSQIIERYDFERDSSLRSLILFIKSCGDVGEFSKARNVLSEFYDRIRTLPENNINKIVYYFLLADIALKDREPLITQNILLRILPEIKLTGLRGLIGEAYYILAETYCVTDNIPKAFENYEMAIDYLDIINFPIELAILYFRKCHSYVVQGNLSQASYYVEKAKKVLMSLGNTNHFSRLYLEEANLNMAQGNVSRAIEQAYSGSKFAKAMGSYRQQVYRLDLIARAQIVQNDFDKAYELLCRTQKIEKAYLEKSKFSYVNIFMHFIESKNNLSNSLNYFDQIHQSQPNKKGLIEYVKCSSKFIYGSTKESDEAIIGLKQLALNSKTPKLIQDMSLNTLKTKKINFVI